MTGGVLPFCKSLPGLAYREVAAFSPLLLHSIWHSLLCFCSEEKKSHPCTGVPSGREGAQPWPSWTLVGVGLNESSSEICCFVEPGAKSIQLCSSALLGPSGSRART
jgi:hypothetical protein